MSLSSVYFLAKKNERKMFNFQRRFSGSTAALMAVHISSFDRGLTEHHTSGFVKRK